MIFIKYTSILLLLLASSTIGILYSKKYSCRVKDLEEFNKAMDIFKSKIKFTYKTIPDVFKEISEELKENISKIFKKASLYMENDLASNAWERSLEEEEKGTNFNKEDIEIIKSLATLLGNSDLDGQINNINLIRELIDKQIEEARIEKNKNEKLYKVLGTSIGLVIAIILI